MTEAFFENPSMQEMILPGIIPIRDLNIPVMDSVYARRHGFSYTYCGQVIVPQDSLKKLLTNLDNESFRERLAISGDDASLVLIKGLGDDNRYHDTRLVPRVGNFRGLRDGDVATIYKTRKRFSNPFTLLP